MSADLACFTNVFGLSRKDCACVDPIYEEIPATVYSHIPDLLDREIRRAQELLAQVR